MMDQMNENHENEIQIPSHQRWYQNSLGSRQLGSPIEERRREGERNAKRFRLFCVYCAAGGASFMTPKGQVGLPEEQRGWFNQTALNPVILDSVRKRCLSPFARLFLLKQTQFTKTGSGQTKRKLKTRSFLLHVERKAGTLFTFDQLPWLAQLPPSSRSLRGKNN
jgi:hypothetical protein